MEYLTNYETCTPDNLIYGSLQKISVVYSKMDIYNADNENPLQKYWFLLKNVKVIEFNDNSMKIALSNSLSNKKFIDYIKKLDKCVHGMISELFDHKYELQSSYYIKKYQPIIFTLKCGSCQIYDENNNLCEELKDLKTKIRDRHCSILIELTDLMFCDDSYWINYSAKQLKINNNPFQNKSIFEMIDTSQYVTSVPPAPPAPPLSPTQSSIPIAPSSPSIPLNRSIATTEQKNPVKFIISVNDLKEQINKMRKKPKENDIDSKMKVIRDEIKTFNINNKAISKRYKEISASTLHHI